MCDNIRSDRIKVVLQKGGYYEGVNFGYDYAEVRHKPTSRVGLMIPDFPHSEGVALVIFKEENSGLPEALPIRDLLVLNRVDPQTLNGEFRCGD